MTVICHFFSQPKYLFKIDRSAYFPSPAVHGALALFKLLPSAERPAVRSEKEFLGFVRQAFSSKRKFIANSLQPRWQRELVNMGVERLGFTAAVRICPCADRSALGVLCLKS
jgi:16S rRNA A1518/A1519 N6-dimethyltransferase RsmA/KsgA/DIM1 with predicted DNA glycosylase/AP lyase activity